MLEEALVLAAGLGTRLRPLTQTRPKPLIEVAGRALLDRNLELLSKSGLRKVFVNTHYLSEQVQSFVADGQRWGLSVEVVHEPLILDTGGAVANIRSRLQSSSLLVVNSDILLSPEFSYRPLAQHFAQATSKLALASLMLRRDAEARTYGVIRALASGQISTFLSAEHPGLTAKEIRESAEFMFTGVSLLSSKLLEGLPSAGSVFSLTRDVFLPLILKGAYLDSWEYTGYFSDVGTLERLAEANKVFS